MNNLSFLEITAFTANDIVVTTTDKTTLQKMRWNFKNGASWPESRDRNKKWEKTQKETYKAASTSELYIHFLMEISKTCTSKFMYIMVTGVPPLVNLPVPFKTANLDICSIHPIDSLDPYFGILNEKSLRKVKITNRITNLGKCVEHPSLASYELVLDVYDLNVLMLSQVSSNNFTVILDQEVKSFQTEGFRELVMALYERPIGFSMKLKTNVFNHPNLIDELSKVRGWKLRSLGIEKCAAIKTKKAEMYVTCKMEQGFFQVQTMEKWTAKEYELIETTSPESLILSAKNIQFKERMEKERRVTWLTNVPYHFEKVVVNFETGSVNIDGVEVSKGVDDLCRVFLKYFLNKSSSIRVLETTGHWNLFSCNAQIKELILHHDKELPPTFFISILHNQLEKLTTDTLEVIKNAPAAWKTNPSRVINLSKQAKTAPQTCCIQ